jgi:DNA cross-link repair 1A protein
MAAKSTPKAAGPKAHTASSKPRQTQTTLVPGSWGKKSTNNGSKPKTKTTPNGNIISFFKKAEEQNNRIFLQERAPNTVIPVDGDGDEEIGWAETTSAIGNVDGKDSKEVERYNEKGGSIKRRKLSEDVPDKACSPPPIDSEDDMVSKKPPGQAVKAPRKTGPFIDDSDSESETTQSRGTEPLQKQPATAARSKSPVKPISSESAERPSPSNSYRPPLLKSEETSLVADQDFDDFEGVDDEFLEGEEYDERMWMEEQSRLELAEGALGADCENMDIPSMFPDAKPGEEDVPEVGVVSSPVCPICNTSLSGLDELQSSVHVNACLDGKPIPSALSKSPSKAPTSTLNNSKMFKKPERPAKPGQANPFKLGESSTKGTSAFSKLMANHAEDTAWATAAVSERTFRGKPSYQRTCPFYKILPGFFICVDAFRYGAVKGQNAYFLSHFHSDHYIGLTSSWSHGPIYCSKVTGNLVRQQLRVDPKMVIDLEFEEKTEIPGTAGVYVTMIPANHCPGSSLFLFEKEIGKGKEPRLQRVLHCGDFRACQAHIEHPLLRPSVLDAVSGNNRQQKLDVCYLDTTYLNPKYAFPPQQQVIKACADMCVSLNNTKADGSDGWEQMKRDRAGQGMVKFIQKDQEAKYHNGDDDREDVDPAKAPLPGSASGHGRLLVVVGTYSIGKERICVGIAKALNSKIYAPPNKQKICDALEDPELNDLLTKNPHEAQVHMTPLFEIRAETLDDYLQGYRDYFSRAVGFRPSGWNYRPPNSRFTESPSVQTVLHSSSWKTQFTMRDLTPQRGSTSRASCFGVPYSEHSSFRELTMFCCALRIDKIIPTVNVANAKTREKMKAWCDKWAADKRKNGLFRLSENGTDW